MKLQFDAGQTFQLDAIAAAVGLFEGQPDASMSTVPMADEGLSSLALSERGVANRRVIDDAQWLANLQKVQRGNGIEPSTQLEPMKLADGSLVGAFPNFTVEMETGTGKTYVYLRTMLDLHKAYGFKKFVIVVPSVAIREGVLASLKDTREHFQALYGHERVAFSVYDSARVNELRNFALSDAVQVLVINIDAFAKDSAEEAEGGAKESRKRSKGNVINQMRETGVRPIEFIQAAQPIVIIDEPQNLETDIRKRALARLNPLCTLRYSATHRDTYNLIYSLDPLKAYEMGLVKQIGVDSVIAARDANQAFVEVEGFKATSRSVSARLTIWVNRSSGGPERKTITARNGADLFALSGQREIYREGFVVNEIDAGEGFVAFANGVRVRQGRAHGALTDEVLRLQIDSTVRRHFEKARKLHPMGVKVLSVFFIDRVPNYRVYAEDGSVAPGKFAQWFEESFARWQADADYAGLMPHAASAVHNGYFAQDRRSVSPFETITAQSNAGAEASTFELIMRQKTRLLDLSEPLAFIFSHSALREGWDNPNVFQICTLAESQSDIKKRQEIGRGLRLCVNQDGQRVHDKAVNRLTVIANESYEDFANQLQAEMAEAGVRFTREMVQNEREKVSVTLRKGYQTDSGFLALWERIRAKTRYEVHYSTAELIGKAAARMRSETWVAIERPKVALVRAELAMSAEGVTGKETGRRTQAIEAKYVMPDFVGQVQGRTGLSKSTVARILIDAGRLGEAVKNPQAFIDQAAEIINTVKHEFLVYGDGSAGSGVRYVKIDGDTYEMRRFEDDDLVEVFASNVIQVGKPGKTLFSHIVIDSNSSVERGFAQACEDNDDVIFYVKLPRWFQIDTPVGRYNPDWALAYRNDQVLYFVAETKMTGRGGPIQRGLLRPLEDYRVECGARHFKEFDGVTFKAVSTLGELLG